MVYPRGTELHDYERTIVDELNITAYMAHADPNNPRTETFGAKYQLASSVIDADILRRGLYSIWSAPDKFDAVLTSRYLGKEVSIKPHQKHIHLAHGVHRGAFHLPPRDDYSNNTLYSYAQKLNRTILKHREQRLLSNVDTLVVNSEFTAQMMQKYHDIEANTIIHPPIHTKDYYTDRESNKKFYLYLGRLAKIKRIEEIVEAFNKIDINLLIAGTGELTRRLKKKSDDNIELLGFVSDKKKKELFSTCSGFIQNSIAEDFGVTTVEALASGAPVIAVDDGNNPNLIQHRVNGVLFDRPGDTDAFKTSESAEQLQEAINTAENINWDHKKIQQTAEPYDVSNFLSKWEAAIDR
jgi:glycosyltransferase involved in cell wall biosynthesis